MASLPSLLLFLCAQALSGYWQVFGRKKQSRWVQEGGKEEGESSSRDADGARRKMSDFQPQFNRCYTVRNQDAPPPHPTKEASWGIPQGREGQ